MENFTGYFKMVYLLPATISLFYLLLQVLSDIKRVKMSKKTAFEDRDHIIDCAMACFVQVLNIYMAYIGIRVIEIVHFTDAHLNLHKEDISYRIHKAEFHLSILEEINMHKLSFH
ncbi:MAG: hypothetical protein ABRQ27_15630 [Clostridiaceae bacterium]